MLLLFLFTVWQANKGILFTAQLPGDSFLLSEVSSEVGWLTARKSRLHSFSAHLRHEPAVVLWSQWQRRPRRNLKVKLTSQLGMERNLSRHEGVRDGEASAEEMFPLSLDIHLVLEPQLLVKVGGNLSPVTVRISKGRRHLQQNEEMVNNYN